MPHSAQTKTPLGTAFVLFATPSHALTAYQALDGKAFQGRILHILPGRKALNAVGDGAEGGDEKKVGLKGEREGKKKAEASKEFSWGELYMNVSRPACYCTCMSWRESTHPFLFSSERCRRLVYRR